jgi:hypothetical protein
MSYESKYYNISSFAEAERSLAAWVLEKLEGMPREKLITLCNLPEIQLSFTGDDWKETTPEEEIISALISDFSLQDLMTAIKKLEN